MTTAIRLAVDLSNRDRPSDAENFYHSFSPDRAEMLSHLSEALKSRPRLSESFAQNLADAQKYIPHFDGDFVTPMMDAIVEDVIVAAAAHGLPRSSRLDRIFFGSTDEEDVVASHLPRPDGSALILVSDAMLGSLTELSQVASLMITPAGRGWISAIRAGYKVLAPDPALIDAITGLLRFKHTSQRCFGVRGALGLRLTERQSRASGFLFRNALRFIMAHELSHFLLNHGTNTDWLLRGENLTMYSNEQNGEFDADRLALELSVTATANAGDSAGPLLPVMGSAISIMAIQATEKGDFVRTGRSHPPAADRLSRLFDSASPYRKAAQRVLRVFVGLENAINAATDFSQPWSREKWSATFKDARIHADAQTAAYYGMFVSLDRAQTANYKSVPGVAELILHEAPRIGCRPLDEGFRLAQIGEPRTALEAWGVSSQPAREFCDKRTPLAFFTLQDELFRAIGQDTTSATIQRMIAILCGKMIEGDLR